MIATGWTSALFFLLLVAPGLLYDLRARKWRVSPHESAFAEVGRIALASIAFSAFGAVVALAAWQWFDGLRFSFERFMLENKYAVENASRALLLLAISTAVSCRVAWAWDAWQRSTAGEKSADMKVHSEWVEVFREDLPPGNKPFVQVTMKDGRTWMGWVEDYTSGVHDASRSLVLSGTMATAEPNGASAKNLDAHWSRVILNGDEIQHIMVRYLKAPVS